MTISPIDPEIAAFLAQLGADWKSHPPLDTLSAPEARAVAEKVRARWREGGPAMASTHDVTVETAAGPLGLRVLRPEQLPDGPAPVLFYIHGGGFVFFSLDSHDRLMREYADAAGVVVIGVDYPLSPEARYPLALDRIVGLMGTLEAHASDWGIDPTRVAVGGDSAGANLALATCLRLRDAGSPQPIRALLSNYGAFSGVVSDEAEAAHGGATAVLTQEEMVWYFDQYLADAAHHADPYAVPLLAIDLSRLPPTLLIVPDRDVLTEQSLDMGGRLRTAGVDVTLEVVAGATHSFLEAMSVSRLARDAIATTARWLAARLS